jgi:hypothetical protein
MKGQAAGTKNRAGGAVEMPGLWKAWKANSRLPTFPSRSATMTPVLIPPNTLAAFGRGERRSAPPSAVIVVDREK